MQVIVVEEAPLLTSNNDAHCSVPSQGFLPLPVQAGKDFEDAHADPATGYLALCSYCVSSIGMTVSNKYVLSVHRFRLPFLLLAVQSLVSVVFLVACTHLHWLDHRRFNRRDACRWLPVSLLMVAMIYTGSRSLQHLTVAMFTVFKNITILVIAFAEWYVFGNPVSRLMLLSFTLIIASSLIGGFNDLNFNLAGYTWMALNCLSSACYGLYMRTMIKGLQFKDFDSVYFNNVLATPVLALLSLLLEDWRGFARN